MRPKMGRLTAIWPLLQSDPFLAFFPTPFLERAYKQERLEDAASAIACAVELDWPNPLYRYMAALIISDMRGYQEAFKMIASLHESKRSPEIWKLGGEERGEG